jgi:hypothetical protein
VKVNNITDHCFSSVSLDGQCGSFINKFPILFFIKYHNNVKRLGGEITFMLRWQSYTNQKTVIHYTLSFQKLTIMLDLPVKVKKGIKT